MGILENVLGKKAQSFDCGCGASFQTKEQLLAHAGKAHPTPAPTKPVTNDCGCGAKFATKEELLAHAKKTHPM
ncbi:MAG: hypothetical protein HY556_03050 [Euryarchaeota archaeon]|nr:hypothetical protein [Euryarchaeota archaeon]